MKFQYKLLTILFTVVSLVGFLACDDASQITKPIIDEILTETIPVTQSRYTGTLRRVGTVENFGAHIDGVQAIEWNGNKLYMLATSRLFSTSAQYLFTLDRETGLADFVNRGAMNLGGDFRQGRNFTQVKYVRPWDMVWDSSGDGRMLGICPVLDSIVSIDIETGVAGRLNWKKDYCLLTTDGYPVIGGAGGIASDGVDFYMVGTAQYSIEDGRPRLAELFRVSNNFRCAIRLSENPPHQFEVGESAPYALCFDGQYLYMSGADTNSLFILDRLTGKAFFVAEWSFVEVPSGYEMHELGVLNVKENTLGGIWITGLAFDGQTMFAVDSFTDALYIVE